MLNNIDLTEPVKAYHQFLKDAYHENVVKYFDNLAAQSKVDIEANRNLVGQIKVKTTKIENVEKSLGKNKALRAFVIFLMVVLFVASLIGIFYIVDREIFEFIPLPIVGILGGVGLIFAVRAVAKKIKEFETQLNKLKKLREELISQAYEQMQALNELYDWNIPAKIVTETTSLIQMDQYFDQNKFYNLRKKYGFQENNENNISTVFVQSGSILGNPFLVQRNHISRMVDHVYSGQKTITWTTVVGSGKNRHVVTHSQTLIAEITKPAADYFHETWLVYGNEAAPRLSFSREPSNANNMNDKQIKKFAEDFERDLERKIRNGSINNKSLTIMGNNEFEALFDATNRDHDVEFRLLFTPLAQKNMLEIIKSKTPYGDDFYFTKSNGLNFIKSRHAQIADLDADPNKFMHYSFDFAQKNFIEYCNNYFQSFYFDLAPLLAIPLYQQHMSFEEIFKGTIDPNLTTFETEMMANRYDDRIFKHAASDTPATLKRELIRKNGTSDIVNIHAYSYQKISHVTVVQKFGGDGRWHDIPVQWYEYVPLENITPFAVQECHTTQQKFNSGVKNQGLANFLSRISNQNMLVYSKGLVSLLLKSTNPDFDANELNKYLQEEK